MLFLSTFLLFAAFGLAVTPSPTAVFVSYADASCSGSPTLIQGSGQNGPCVNQGCTASGGGWQTKVCFPGYPDIPGFGYYIGYFKTQYENCNGTSSVIQTVFGAPLAGQGCAAGYTASCNATHLNIAAALAPPSNCAPSSTPASNTGSYSLQCDRNNPNGQVTYAYCVPSATVTTATPSTTVTPTTAPSGPILQKTTIYGEASCLNAVSFDAVLPSPTGSCVPSACTNGRTVTCEQASTIQALAGGTAYVIYTGSSCVVSAMKRFFSVVIDVCITGTGSGPNDPAQGTGKYTCTGSTLMQHAYSTSGCTGTVMSQIVPGQGGACVTGNDPGTVSTFTGCPATPTNPPVTAPPDNSCFHESTVITLPGSRTKYSLTELHQSGLCRIPHRVQNIRGVVVHSKGLPEPLRVTPDHLVFVSRRGLVKASSLVPGDIIFTDFDQTRRATVESVTPEQVPGDYLGLNCLDSTVLANGVLCSTFGRYHFVPSLWMKVLGSLVGVERASRWGDAIVGFMTS